jgi:TolB-like protein
MHEEEWKAEDLTDERILLVRAHLQEILDGEAFRGGKRAQTFLLLVVEHAIAGRVDNLRERMLGVEMFGRSVDYDTANDAVVRVKASEVRKRLIQHYRSLPGPSSIRIDLLAGSYAPRFFFVPPSPIAAAQLEEAETFAAAPASGAVIGRDGLPPQSSRGSSKVWALVATGCALVLVAGWYAWHRWSPAAGSHTIRTLAILPLSNLSGDPKQEYFADGMTEELITEVGQIAALRVISRTSAMTYKGTHKTVPEIARELHVDGIVEGSIDREGNRVRITAQLIDSLTDQHLWAHTYDRDLTSVIELQGDMARSIADQIRIQLTPIERAHFDRMQSVNPDAVEFYLQGLQHENIADPKNAFEDFKQAVAKAPNYAAAHSALASVYGWLGSAGWMSYAEAYSGERKEALRAIELDDSLPEPHLALASAAMERSFDWATQTTEIKRALSLSPNAPDVVQAYASYLIHRGKSDEAVTQSKISLQLDPLSSRSLLGAAFIAYYARNYDLALLEVEQADSFQHRPDEAYFPLGVVDVEKGRYNEGIDLFQKIGDQPHALGHLGNAYARAGRIAEAHAILPRLKEHIEKKGIGRYEIAIVYAGLHDNDSAFQWLEEAFTARDKGLTYLKIDPCLDPLRSDPRFASLMKRVGFTDEPTVGGRT